MSVRVTTQCKTCISLTQTQTHTHTYSTFPFPCVTLSSFQPIFPRCRQLLTVYTEIPRDEDFFIYLSAPLHYG